MMLKFPLLCFLSILLLFCSSFWYGEAAMIFTMSALECIASFMSCSEIEGIELRLAAQTALRDGAVRSVQEEAADSLEKTTKN
jgi:hypothetical protein